MIENKIYFLFILIILMICTLGPSHGSTLTWHLRMKIAVDVAR